MIQADRWSGVLRTRRFEKTEQATTPSCWFASGSRALRSSLHRVLRIIRTHTPGGRHLDGIGLGGRRKFPSRSKESKDAEQPGDGISH
jgi:hypothetical protein